MDYFHLVTQYFCKAVTDSGKINLVTISEKDIRKSVIRTGALIPLVQGPEFDPQYWKENQ